MSHEEAKKYGRFIKHNAYTEDDDKVVFYL